jgi:uncharacterized membrane protein YbhN (UPF0104 family)
VAAILVTAGRALRSGLLRLEEKPFAVVIASAGATLGVALALAASAGWPKVISVVDSRHSWIWLAACFAGEVAAYGGYVLSLRDMARVDQGPELDLSASTKTVVAGFGVFAATRSSGGFAVDYWAFRREGASRRDAVARVLALGFLEYAVLGLVALVAGVAMLLRLDGHASPSVTLPTLLIVPAFAFAYWATAPQRARRLSRPCPHRSWPRRLFADAVAGARNVRAMLTSPREHGTGVAGMAIYWAGDIFCLWAALRLVGGTEITLSALVLAYSGGYVLSRRALPAGGAGVVEVALTFALVGMGAPLAPALIGVVVYRLFNFWLPIVPALVLIPTVRELRERFVHADRSTSGISSA